jgi:hypothetical protein
MLEKCEDFSELLEICVAADKYQVEGLLETCVDWLCEDLNTDTVCEMFDLANQYNLQKLKEYCIRVG